METIVDILKYTLPLIVVLLVVIWIVYYLLKLERERAAGKIKSENAGSMLKVRLQAYERLLLFLERISPQQLVLRNNNPALSVREFQDILIANIREEYEHNLVQQLYVSEECWNKIVYARSWVMKLVNDAATKLDPNAGAGELAMLIVEKEMATRGNFQQEAIRILKQEIQQLF